VCRIQGIALVRTNSLPVTAMAATMAASVASGSDWKAFMSEVTI